MFKRVLSFAGYVPAAEMEAVVKSRNELIASLGDMTIARDGLARMHTQMREELGAANDHLADLQARYDNILAEYEFDLRVWREKELDWQTKDREREVLSEQLDAANTHIAELQQQRPQMRLMQPEGENRRPSADDEEPVEDEIIVKPHTVEMSGRLIIIAFEGRTFWTLSVNDHQFKVPVHDRKFLDDGQLVGKGTIIRAEFLETTFRDPDGEPYTTRSLEHVLEVIPPAPQNTQPLFDAPAASERS